MTFRPIEGRKVGFQVISGAEGTANTAAPKAAQQDSFSLGRAADALNNVRLGGASLLLSRDQVQDMIRRAIKEKGEKQLALLNPETRAHVMDVVEHSGLSLEEQAAMLEAMTGALIQHGIGMERSA